MVPEAKTDCPGLYLWGPGWRWSKHVVNIKHALTCDLGHGLTADLVLGRKAQNSLSGLFSCLLQQAVSLAYLDFLLGP